MWSCRWVFVHFGIFGHELFAPRQFIPQNDEQRSLENLKVRHSLSCRHSVCRKKLTLLSNRQSFSPTHTHLLDAT